ncbi:MAG: BPL-N domain-containing protein [Kiritimatiellaeota bacterium]|nr:BPL-N domain-containing protein [Kiritimatiellota bacterium]
MTRWFMAVVVGIALDCPAGQAASSSPSCVVRTNWICAGTPQATPYYVMDSGQTGPVVMVIGGMHGDEEGAASAGQIAAWNVRRGKLVVLPQANRQGVLQHVRLQPAESNAALRDLNRNFPSKTNAVPRGALAAAIWAETCALKPDWLIDLHEGYQKSEKKPDGIGNTVIVMNRMEKLPALSNMLVAVNASMSNAAQYFRLLRQPIGSSLARAAGDRLKCNALIVESCRDNPNISERTRVHRLIVHSLLRDLAMDVNGPDVLARKNPAVILVAAYDDSGGHTGIGVAQKLNRTGDIQVHRVDNTMIEAGVLDQFDVLFAPGGSGSVQARELGKPGREAVRKFVHAGGGYVGICAGAYLASRSQKRPYLGILNASIADFDRGRDLVTVELTDAGRKLLGSTERELKISYHNGPVWGPGSKLSPACQVLGVFRTEVFPTNRTTTVTMNGTPALITGTYGKGRIICSSPHP